MLALLIGALVGGGAVHVIMKIRYAMALDIIKKQPMGMAVRDIARGEIISRGDMLTHGTVKYIPPT